MTNFMKEYERQEKEALDKAKLVLKDVCAVLEPFGIIKVDATYDGAGDSGAVEDVSFFTQKGKYDGELPTNKFQPLYSYTNPPEPVDIKQIIEDACCHFLPGGWEINEGSYGTLSVDVKTRTVTLEYNERYMDVNSREEAIKL
jgi:hypothetical protein